MNIIQRILAEKQKELNAYNERQKLIDEYYLQAEKFLVEAQKLEEINKATDINALNTDIADLNAVIKQSSIVIEYTDEKNNLAVESKIEPKNNIQQSQSVNAMSLSNRAVADNALPFRNETQGTNTYDFATAETSSNGNEFSSKEENNAYNGYAKVVNDGVLQHSVGCNDFEALAQRLNQKNQSVPTQNENKSGNSVVTF